jgi:hypothetical protein
MNGQTDFTVKAELDDFKNTLFLAMELSRATWLVATFAPRLGDKINVHAIPGGDTKRLLELIGRLVLQPRGRPQGPGPAYHDHRARAQAGDRSLAIRRDRQGADRRNCRCLTS